MNEGRYDRGPVAPKPFDYVPFADRVEKAPPAGHHHYDPELLTGYLAGEIVVLTPLHVASGGIELTERAAPQFARQSPLIKAFVRSGGVRVIPGSTLKGAVRSVVEAITPSTVGKVDRRTGVPQALEEPRGIKKDRPPENNPLSPADRMFGVMDYLGPVQFSDASQIGDAVVLVEQPSLFAPRTRGPVKGRKFYKHGRPARGNVPVEAVPPEGGRFVWRCDFSNLSAAELGVLLIALGQGDPPLHLKLGGGKPACYGSVRVQLAEICVRSDVVGDYLSWEGTETADEPGVYVQAALEQKGFVLRPQWQKLSEILKWPSQRDCPSEAY